MGFRVQGAGFRVQGAGFRVNLREGLSEGRDCLRVFQLHQRYRPGKGLGSCHSSFFVVLCCDFSQFLFSSCSSSFFYSPFFFLALHFHFVFDIWCSRLRVEGGGIRCDCLWVLTLLQRHRSGMAWQSSKPV